MQNLAELGFYNAGGVEAFKFLDRLGGTVLTGFRWPLPAGAHPGPWVEAAGVRPCYEGIHGCLADDLAYWISDELWVIQLEGEVVAGHHKVVCSRGRVIRRIDRWQDGLRWEMGTDAAWRARDIALELATTAGEDTLAARLGACTSLAQLAGLRTSMPDSVDRSGVTGVAALLAGDCAFLAERGEPAEAPFVAACAAGHASAGTDRDRYDQAFHAERERQSRWLAERITAAP